MKKCICLILILIISASALISYSATAAQEPWVFSDGYGIYSVSFSGRDVSIASFGDYDVTADLRLDSNIDKVCVADNKVVMFCNDPMNEQLIVSVYDISADELDSFAINRRTVYTSTCCCCDSDYIYIANENKLEQYSYNGAYKRSFSFRDYVTYTAPGYDSGIYAVSDDELYYLEGGSMTLISGADASSPIVPLGEDLILTGSGKIQTIGGDYVTNTAQTDAGADAGQACVIGSIMYCPSGSVIYGYDVDSGERICSYQCDRNVRFVYSVGNTVYALDSAFGVIASPDKGSFTYKQNSSGNDSSSGSNSGGSGGNNSGKGANSSDGQIPDGMPKISSDVYDVSYDDYIISRIPAGTTLGKFKSNMDYGSCSVKLYRGEAEKTSGNVGTSMMADFIKGNDALRFELSVVGDLTGEGSANSRDMSILLDYLNGSANFNGAYELSADINGDGNIDVVDAAKLRRMY